MVELDRRCMSVGMACTRCGIVMPNSNDSPRLCPAVNDDVSREETKKLSPYNYETDEYESDESIFQCKRDDCDEKVTQITSSYCSQACQSVALQKAAKRLEELAND